MKAVITVIGKDRVGILARVGSVCAECRANIVDVTQSVMQDIFAMVTLVELDNAGMTCAELAERMDALAKELNLSIHVMHEDLFNSMHRI